MAAALLNKFEKNIKGITLVPSDGGRFEVSVDDDLVFSKLETGQHADPNEVINLVSEYT